MLTALRDTGMRCQDELHRLQQMRVEAIDRFFAKKGA